MSLSDRNPMTGIRSCDPVTIPCRYCDRAKNGHYTSAECEVFEDKPDNVYFENAPCPHYSEAWDRWHEELANRGLPEP